MSRSFPPGLLLITDRARARFPLETVCRSALEGGMHAVMLREKDLPARPLLELACALKAVCDDFGAPLLINDRVDVALALAETGVHLGIRGLPVAEARRLLGPDRLIGYSAHSAGEARTALLTGADYITLSPVFRSASKPELTPQGPGMLKDAARLVPTDRTIALGGVDEETLPQLLPLRLGGAAVMGAVMTADDTKAVAAALVKTWALAGEGA